MKGWLVVKVLLKEWVKSTIIGIRYRAETKVESKCLVFVSHQSTLPLTKSTMMPKPINP